MAYDLFQNILNKAKSTFANQDPTQNLQYKAINKLAGGISAVTWQGMADPTQSLMFKGIQWGANLYTWVTNRLQETAQADIADKQKKIDDEARKYASHLASKGYSQERIFQTLDILKKEWKLTASPNFAERLVGWLGDRMQTIAEWTQRLSQEDNLLKRMWAGTAFYGGSAVATAMTPVGAALQPVVEPIVKPIMETDTAQSALQYASKFDKENPIASLALQWAGNLADLAPVPLIKPVASGIKKGTVATGKALVRWAEKVAPTIKSIPKAIKKAPWAVDDLIESGVEKIATKALGSSDGTAELFKATSPSYNVLAKSKDIGKIKQKARIADEAVIEAGYVPKTTTERVDAYKATMKKVWDDVEQARWAVPEKYKSDSIAKTIRDEVDKMKVNGKIPPSLEADVRALLKEADFYRSLGDVSLPDLWVIRSNINARLTFWDKTQFSDAYNAVMKKVITTIKEWEDAVLTRNAGQATSGLLAKYWALRSMLDDVIKQDIKASRAKWLPIEESFGRISGLAEMAWWVGQLVMNPKQAIPSIVSGGSKVLLGKVAWKLKDTDYLIKTGYEKLLKSKKPTNGTPKWNTPVVRPNSTRPTSQQKVKPIVSPKKPVEKTVKPNQSTNAKQQVSNTNAGDTIPEGYFKNIFWEIQPLPSNKKGGFIKIPWGKPIVKRASDVDWLKLNMKLIEEYYQEKTWMSDVSEILERFKKSSIENQKNVMDKIYKSKQIKQKAVDTTRTYNDIIQESEKSVLKSPLKVYRWGSVKSNSAIESWNYLIEKHEWMASTAGWNLYWVSTSSSREIANDFAMGKWKGTVIELEIKPWAKVLNWKSKDMWLFDNLTQWDLKKIKDIWYDVIIDKDNIWWEMEVRILNTEVISKPKSLSPQKTVKPKNLTESKQSATMGDMETKKLIEEARKYKSAEEYLNKDVITYLDFQKSLWKEKDILESWHNKKVYKDLKIKISDIAPTWQQKTAIADIKSWDKSFTKRPVTLIYRNWEIEIKDWRHRTAEAILRWDKYINANIIDMSWDLPKNFSKYYNPQ